MSQFWGLSVSNDRLVECAVQPFLDRIHLCTGDAEAWGLGYYHSGELLQRIEPRKKGEPLDLSEVIGGIQADIVLMHTRVVTTGTARRENTHPFRFKNWLFAHNGTLMAFDAVKEQITDAMPPFISRGIKGDTDSEHLFHLFLSFLYDAGVIGRTNPGPGALRDALYRTFSMADELGKNAGFAPSPFSAIVSDGYSLVALSRGIPVDYAVIDGIIGCEICRGSIIPGDPTLGQVDHRNLKAVMIRSGSFNEPKNEFQRLQENSFLLANKDHNLDFSKFE